MSQSMDAVLEHRRRHARRWLAVLAVVGAIVGVGAFQLSQEAARTGRHHGGGDVSTASGDASGR